MGAIGCPETSVRNYHSTLHKIPNDRRSQIPNFMEICPVGVELFHADGRMDMKKIVVAFRNFVNAPNNIPSSYIKALNNKK